MRFVIFKYFLPVHGLTFHYLRAKILNFDDVQGLFFYIDHTVGVVAKKSFPHKITKIFSCFLLEILQFSFYILVCDPFQVNFCIQCKVKIKSFVFVFIFAQEYPNVLAQFLEKSPFSLLNTLVNNQMTKYVGCLSGFPISSYLYVFT